MVGQLEVNSMIPNLNYTNGHFLSLIQDILEFLNI